MKNPSICRGLALSFIAASAALAACAEERPPPTRDEVLYACGQFNLESCRAFGRCLGWDAARVQECVNREDAKCADDLQEETCWEQQEEALQGCAVDISDDSCADVCGDDGFCFAPCSYFCP